MTTSIPTLRDVLWNVLRNYGTQRELKFGENAWRENYAKSTVNFFESRALYSGLIVHGSAGRGNWAEVPWIGLRHPSITSSFQDGVYLVYLYPTDFSGVYLSLNQGVTTVKETSGFREAGRLLRRRGEQLRATLDIEAVLKDHNYENIVLKAKGENGLLYEAGHICGLYYPVTRRITSTLEDDLGVMLSLYSRVVPILAPMAISLDSSALHESSLEQETDEFLQRLALDTTTDVQSGTETAPVLRRRRKRQQALRNALLRAYAPECAACGFSFCVETSHMLHAAHVIDVRDRGASVVRNGLLLCPHHHWAFDRGCWAITDDYRVKVHPSFVKYHFLAAIDGRPLAAPNDVRFRLDPKAIAVRRERWETLLASGKVPPEPDDPTLLEEAE